MNNKVSKIAAGILLGTMLTYTVPVTAFTKDETVYSNLKSNGEEYKTIVTTHIINEDDEKLLKDMTDLLNIENTSGDEKFTQDGTSIVWEANENDIYYKGETQKELPIDINVRYELDGKEISSEEIAGKTGKVKITIEITNKDEHEVTIKNKTEKMYTPFIVATGIYIDNEHNKNIEVTNGKIIDDGSKTMIVGLTFPGMQENLNINKSNIEIPTTIEITMDSKNFEMKNIINYVTPKIIEKTDLDIFSKLNDIYNKINKLQSASKQIEDGANTLAEGTATYIEKSEEFNNAINQFSNGINTANKSYEDLDEGINTLNNSIPTLTSGSKQISDGLSQVNYGVKTMNDKLSASEEKITDLQKGIENIVNGISNLNSNIVVEDNTNKINTINNQIISNSQNIARLKQSNQKMSELLKDETLSEDFKLIINNQININNESIENLTKDNNHLEETITSLKRSTEITRTIKENLDRLESESNQVTQGINILIGNIGELSQGVSSLYDNTEKLTLGANTLYDGTLTLRSGSNQLKVGSKQMKDGLSILTTNAKTIYVADSKLLEGAKTIEQGAAELAQGTKKFNESAINPICNYIIGDVKDLSIRAEKLKELSEKYNTFTKLNEEQNKGKVKFITIIDSIKNTDENKSQEEVDKKTSK
ncbi:MAG: hypothetical protein J6K45_02955 [Clostridia bacterium]|nr:hypothetical protein [Clostridia bacterium]